MKCTLELFIGEEWLSVALFDVPSPIEIDKGYSGSGFLSYEESHADAYFQRTDIAALSSRYPVNYTLYEQEKWPSFLLDLLPSGAGRRQGLARLGIADGPKSDWPLLLNASGSPVGNIRIAEAARKITANEPHPGFMKSEVVTRRETFIEYAEKHGAPVAGSTGVQGDAPKFLLTQDRRGRWHADAVLSDDRAARHWLVKFPRGKAKSDRQVLRNEAAYARVARSWGVRVGKLPSHENDVLFVPRFDRIVRGKKVIRLGQESLCSLAGVSEFGAKIPQETLAEAIANHCSDPKADLREFLVRDILNIAMGNTDNHARNTAVSKYPNGKVAVSPLYDFAPMILDDQGIPRSCRWNRYETPGGYPDWAGIAGFLGERGADAKALFRDYSLWSAKLRRLPGLMKKCGVEDFLIKRLQLRIEEVAASLERASKSKPIPATPQKSARGKKGRA